jgi:hypothetical protein
MRHAYIPKHMNTFSEEIQDSFNVRKEDKNSSHSALHTYANFHEYG